MSEPHDDGSSAARRTLLLLVAAITMAVGAGIVLVVGGGDESEPVDESSVLGAIVTGIGPAEGTSIAPYVEARRAALGEAEGLRLAVVSFDVYLPVADVEATLGEGVALRSVVVVLPGGAPTVTADPAATRSAVVEDARTQIQEITGLLPTVEDDEFEAFYRAELERFGLVVASADRADVVAAAVVRGTAAELRALATRSEVRLVDVAAGTELDPDASVRGLRPEETTTVGTPEFRPA